MEFSPRTRLFFGLISGLFVLNLLIANDYMTIWPGPELYALFQVRVAEAPALSFWHVEFWVSAFEGIESWSLFGIRLLNPLLLILGAIGFRVLARPLFGSQTISLSFMVTAGSLLLVNMGKFVNADILLLVAQVFFSILLLRYMKKPESSMRPWIWGVSLLLVWVHPLSALISGLVLYVWLRWLHPQGKALDQLFLWGLFPVLGLGAWMLGRFSVDPGLFLFAFGEKGVGSYLLWQLIGLFPWLGFLASGLRDYFLKARKGEELAIILFGLIVSGLLSMSLLPQLALSIMVAKQLSAYFLPGFPYRNWVRGGAVIHLIVVFCLGTLAMLNGFYLFESAGFRSAMIICAVYWIWTFVSVIGLYGMNKRYIWLGMSMAGIMITTFFWLQGAPLFQQKRSMVQRGIDEAADWAGKRTDTLYVGVSAEKMSYFQLYGNLAFDAVVEQEEAPIIKNPDRSIIWVTDQPGFESESRRPILKQQLEKGWTQIAQQDSLWVVKYGPSGILENKK